MTDPIRARLDDISDHGFSGLAKTLFDQQANALRAVLDLHWLTGTGYCYRCGIGPCNERRGIAESLGVTDES